MITAETLARLKAAAGKGGFSEDPGEIAPHVVEWRGTFHGTTPLLLKPRTTAEVSSILAICNEARTPVVPQGGNTGLVGGQIPGGGEILLSLSRMKRIRDIDQADRSMVAEAGAVLADAQRAADEAGLFFPLSLAAEGSCTIGGNVSTNAGGVNVLRYGTMRDLVLGLEVVLADGTVLEMLRRLRKDNTGYDLKQLFIGAEGTLGIVTAAALKLVPKLPERATAFVGLAGPAAALAILSRLQDASGGLVTAFELLPRSGLEMVLAHIPRTTDPLAKPHPWYVLVELASPAGLNLLQMLEGALAAALERGEIADAAIAHSERERAALWHLRESMSEAQKYEGASLKHDVSVPVSKIPELLGEAERVLARLVPCARPVPFGHAGDGNIHLNVSVPKGGDDAAFAARRMEVSCAIHDLVHALGGSISAEHGIGVAKRDALANYKPAAEIALMRALKRTLDPHGILNPGKLLPGTG